MSRYYTRRDAGLTENLGAALVAAGVGAAVFYLTRLLIVREPLLLDAPYSGRNIGEGDPGAGDRASLTSGPHDDGEA